MKMRIDADEDAEAQREEICRLIKIDLLSENEDNISMPPRTTSLSIEQQRIHENNRKNEAVAREMFPNEQWVDASSFKIEQQGPDFELPKNLDNVKVAKSRIIPSKNKKTISDNDAKTLAKELRQAGVLTSRGASVFITPKLRNAQGRDVPGPDALVNGTLFEFKTVTGSIDKVESRFRESRSQGQNVFIRVMNPNVTKYNIIRKMYNVLNDPKYTGGFKGDLLFSVGQGVNETLYHIKISDLKK